ncbi:hypothetical protein WOLCODRAFT_116172 [Wolfiporia cocos MD-104 SS10]|uniref:Uncharacterized protein n=1 Tax=Wolfiporia cocos (strain MD-104) TaxID=742152 RepID=A0A2H3JDY7_WOLCO|nr:hypothetical protein WOLCODRAFT_116172 [Wolfiporia cocos MD-104 SS10]
MAIMDSSNGDQDIMHVWSLLSEVSEQLSQNRSTAVSLHTLASEIKTQAIHSQTGFVLRRFNLDKPKEVYDAELERMNAAMSAENQTLQNDNRQLNALIREYEQTLENLMSSFRSRAFEVQERELALMRAYEQVIIQRETEALEAALAADSDRSESLARVGRLLRVVMRKLNGEDVKVCEALTSTEALGRSAQAGPSRLPSSATLGAAASGGDQADPADTTPENAPTDGADPELDPETSSNEDPDMLQRRLAAAEWALERESELARLERENEELRNLLNGIWNPEAAASRAAIPRSEINVPSESGRMSPAELSVRASQLGGRPGTVGPFGTYKRRAISQISSGPV